MLTQHEHISLGLPPLPPGA